MTRKQVRNAVRRHLGDGASRYKVRAYRERGRCVVSITMRSGQPAEQGVRAFTAIARDWSHAMRQAKGGLWVEP